MLGHRLLDALREDFGITGTAGHPVYVRNLSTGAVYEVIGTEREVHEDADGKITHWITVKEV